MPKLSKKQRQKNAERAWRTRKKKYGKDGLTPRGLSKVRSAAKKKKRKRGRKR